MMLWMGTLFAKAPHRWPLVQVTRLQCGGGISVRKILALIQQQLQAVTLIIFDIGNTVVTQTNII
jgi:cobalamin biosynthesis protein CbiG